MRRKQFSSLLLAVLILGAPASAHALSLNITGGSVDLAMGCSDMFCFSQTLELGAGGNASGTIDTDGATIDVALSIDLWSLDAIAADDNGITSVEFSNMTYTASFAHNGTLTDFNGAGLGSASGTLTQFDGAVVEAGPSAFAASPAINVDCEETATNVFKCGIVIAGSTFPFEIGGGLTQTRYAPHTADVTAQAVPEPATSVMALTVGLLGLAYAGRRNRN